MQSFLSSDFGRQYSPRTPEPTWKYLGRKEEKVGTEEERIEALHGAEPSQELAVFPGFLPIFLTFH